MSWKVSMVIIENSSKEKQDEKILRALGWNHFALKEETTLSENLSKRDGTISIGYYNNAIVICDDYKFSKAFCTNDYETKEEKALCEVFPNKEILSINCNGTHNAHGYSLTKNGKKQRFKYVMEGFPKCEGGRELKEEKEIYETAFKKENNVYQWKYDSLPDAVFLENQLMEEFTFKVGKRILGVELGTAEDEELMSKIIFKKYKKLDIPNESPLNFQKTKLTEIPNQQTNSQNQTFSKITNHNEEMIEVEEFSTIRWQSEMFARLPSYDKQIRWVSVSITTVLMVTFFLGITYLIAFGLKLIGFPMGKVYWGTAIVFLIFLLSRIYKALKGEKPRSNTTNSILKSAKANHLDIDRINRRVVQIKQDGIDYISEDGKILTFAFSEMIFAQIDHEVLLIANRDTNLVNTLKLMGLSKEDKYQIKKWLAKKSNNNRQFKWTDLT